MTYTHAITSRYSTRAYADKAINKQTLNTIESLIHQTYETPFGTKPAFSMVNLTDLSEDDFKSFGTYGAIKNAKYFIVGTTIPSKEALIDYGYALEHIVLSLTQLNLATCWLGGNFDKSRFDQASGIDNLGIIPSILAFGHHLQPKNPSRKRKPVSELILQDKVPVITLEGHRHEKALQSFILSPSAINGQPWRLHHETQENQFNFFMKKSLLFTALSHTIRKGIQMNYLDLGIAMSHFHLSAFESGHKGTWIQLSKDHPNKSLEYIMTWQGHQ